MKHTIGLYYSCWGHWTLAAERAGLKVLWHVQPEIYNQKLIDKKVEAVLRANWPKIETGGAKELPQIIAGSPPCIGLSQANPQAGIKHPANKCIFDFFGKIMEYKPELFLMEMVPQVLTRGRPILIKVHKMIAVDYNVGINTFDIEEYGSPSRRSRVYFFGIQRTLETEETHPLRIYRSLPKSPSPGVGPMICSLKVKYDRMKADGRQIMSRRNKDGSLRRGEYSCIAKNPVKRTLKYDEPSMTITGAACDTIIHYDKPRFLGVLEVSRLMGFPDTFNFNPAKRKLQARQYSKLIASGVQIDFTANLLRHIVERVYGGRRV